MSHTDTKTYNKILVPWFNSNEWRYVYDLIFSDKSDKLKATEIINLWKLRVPKLPSGVEGTLIILEAFLQDTNISDNNLRLLYGTSLMRFINICGAYTDKQESFYKTAKKNNLPDWLIDLRNDLAHDQKVPSKHVLLVGLEYCLEWLKSAYWDQQKSTIMDYDASEEDEFKNVKLQIVVPLYLKLNDLQHLYPNKNTIQKAMGATDEVCEKLNALCNIKKITLKTDINFVIKKLFNIIKNVVRDEKHKAELKIISDSLLGEKIPNSFVILSKNKDKISHDVIMRWKNLIELLYQEDLLIDFILKLFNKSCHLQCSNSDRLAMSLWLSELFEALQHTYLPQNKSDKEVQKRLNFTPAKHSFLEKLKKNVSDVILMNPHEFSKYFVPQFLELLQYPQQFIEDTLNTMSNYTVLQKKEEEFCNQLTIEEVSQFLNDSDKVLTQNFDVNWGEINDNDNICKSKWTLVKDTRIFEGCPLGVLANQSRDFNPLLTI